MSAAATAAGYLYASGILGKRRQERQDAQPAAPKPVTPKPAQVTYRKKRV